MNAIVDTSSDMTVALTILQQLGGKGFAFLVGARDFVYDESSLSFRIMEDDDEINKVVVRLNWKDLYDVEFWHIGELDLSALEPETRMVSREEDVYAEDLRAIFTARTGLVTFFPTIRVIDATPIEH